MRWTGDYSAYGKKKKKEEERNKTTKSIKAKREVKPHGYQKYKRQSSNDTKRFART